MAVTRDLSDGCLFRLDTPLLFPAARGGHIDGERFRYREWKPAFRAADVDYRRVYDTRHTFATWALHGGMSLFHLSRVMGTSIAQLDQTYGHLLPRPDVRAPAAGLRGVSAWASGRVRRPSGRGYVRCCVTSPVRSSL
jgi:integrase